MRICAKTETKEKNQTNFGNEVQNNWTEKFTKKPLADTQKIQKRIKAYYTKNINKSQKKSKRGTKEYMTKQSEKY